MGAFFWRGGRRAGVDPWGEEDRQAGASVQVRHLVLPFTFADHASLLAGMGGFSDGGGLYVPAVGDLLINAWFQTLIAFNGTTPLADIGTFVNSAVGLFAINAKVDLTAADTPGDPNSYGGQGLSINNTVAPLDSWAGPNQRAAPTTFSGTNPMLVVANQTGAVGGAEMDSTAGSAIAHLLVLPAP